MNTLILKPGREKSILRKHPWIFSGAVGKVEGDPGMGDTVLVKSAGGEKLGVAAYSPHSSIRARIWTFDVEQDVDSEYFQVSLEKAIALRKQIHYLNGENNSCRMVYAESDGIPGLIVDQYNDVLVVQFLSAGPEKWKPEIVKALIAATGIENIYERSDAEVRKLEGLPQITGPISGDFNSSEIEVVENGMRFLVDIDKGQKTGFYLDQRLNRKAIQKFAQDKKILNCFSYSGAFTVYALKAGARQVTSIDSSESAHDLAQRNMEMNHLPGDSANWITGDVFKELRLMRDKGMSFDMVILDPPKFAPTTAQIRSASRGYKDINLLAFKLLNPNGLLATFSCSGGIEQKLFQKIVADAAIDAEVDGHIIEQLSQGPDHPISLCFPESAYLKGLVCRVTK